MEYFRNFNAFTTTEQSATKKGLGVVSFEEIKMFRYFLFINY